MVLRGPTAWLVALLALLGLLAATIGLGAAGWAVGLASGTAICGLTQRGLRERVSLEAEGPTVHGAMTVRRAPSVHRVPRVRRVPRVHRVGASLGPADHVTSARAVFVCGVAALVADAAFGDPAAASSGRLTGLVGLSCVALALDAVDGPVARLTRTASRFGARFDMEIDALLILVLSLHVAREIGWWVTALGAARYLLLTTQHLAAWLRAAVPARRWRKVVAAYQGLALTTAATAWLDLTVARALLAAALAALVVSFGTEVGVLAGRRPNRGRQRHGTPVSLLIPVSRAVTDTPASVSPQEGASR